MSERSSGMKSERLGERLDGVCLGMNTNDLPEDGQGTGRCRVRRCHGAGGLACERRTDCAAPKLTRNKEERHAR